MIKLKELDIKEFNKKIYKYYINMFPMDERKSKLLLKKLINNGYLKIIGIYDDKKLVGFMLLEQAKNNKYLMLDYFGIFPQYQNIGYGTQAITELQKMYSNIEGVFAEVESYEFQLAKNKMTKKRINFYKNNNFKQLNFVLG